MKLSYPLDHFLKNAEGDDRLLPTHISLFIAMFYYRPDDAGGDYFQVSRKKLMRFSRIKSVATYHKCIRELVAYGYIIYQPTYDPYRASKVSLNVNSSRT
ncbi:hypothetical protein [Mucilaginibacter sp.]|jgi:hypothetical protein|uniref:hypothetical protein n=1 Tax=Mucilaginibacter sp. TaxID=1882438 RepID=UPI0026047833|nr:hypothetical protein [Mucilaginibacter sp.]MDB4926560.1 Transcriptional regulator [Mucilaginibacter sp.]